ncbi:MAG: LPS assembly protein LptD [Planctomycetota bacterium]
MPTLDANVTNLRAIALLALLSLTWSAARAQAPNTDAPGSVGPIANVDPLDITGRDFAGQRLPLEAVDGPIRMRAARTWAWEEPARVAPGGRRLHPVRRLFLEGDVLVELGPYDRFSARSATLWLKPINDVDPDADGRTWQVFAYFDEVGSGAVDAAVGLTADRLPVEAVIRADSPIELRTDARLDRRPDDALVFDGEGVLASYLRRLVRGDRPGSGPSAFDASRVLRPAEPRFETGDGEATAEEIEDFLNALPPASGGRPIFADEGIVTLSVGNLTLSRSETENSIIASGGVVVQYAEADSSRILQMDAERAVIFLKPGPLASLVTLAPEDIYGIYLEGDVVATDGEYTLRGPRVYYDLTSDRALILDAVFWTYDARRRMAVYLRAEAIRQEADNQFSAERATLANTAFFSPHLAVGVRDITLRREPIPGGGGRRTIADARGVTLRGGGVPFFYIPRLKGDPEAIPLEAIGYGDSRGSGPVISTTWDLATLLGVEKPKGVDVDILADAYFERGAGLGANIDWDRGANEGGLFTYMLPQDSGTDRSRSGSEIDRDDEFRGLVLFENRWTINDRWTLLSEAAHVSDELFVDVFFRELGRNRREFTNRLALRYIEENEAFYAIGQINSNDFTPNEYLLQSQGYTVDRLPELSYHRIGDDVLESVAPGLLSYFAEYRYSRMRFNFVEPTASELGFTTRNRSLAAFGLDPNDTLGDRLRASGLNEDEVNRFDMRHELSSQLAAGPVNLTPFAVGRLTAYDSNFSGFSPNEEDRVRLWGSVGIRAATQFHRVDNSVESRLFDLHRIRHIIEPGVTVMHSGSTIDSVNLPVYDESVESIIEGTLTRIGVRQTWQTYRGGPGRWRSVDVLELDTAVVITSDDADRDSTIGRYFEYRPELSNAGEYFTADATWRVSDAVALAGSTIYDFEANQAARHSAGALVQHSPRFSSFAEVRFINPVDSTYLDFGANYEITKKYNAAFAASWDADEDEFQRLSVQITREFPNAELGFSISRNEVTDDTSFGFILRPLGFGQSFGVRGVGSRTGNGSAGGV